MDRIEINVQTGAVKTIPLTQAEIDAGITATAVETAYNLPDLRAGRALDVVDRLQLDVLFTHENRLRALELKTSISQAQFRDALILRWKQLNP